MISSKVSPKGLTTVPSEIRKIMNINIGDTLIWKVEKCEDEEVIHIHIFQDPFKALAGKRNDPSITYDKVEHLADQLINEELKPEK